MSDVAGVGAAVGGAAQGAGAYAAAREHAGAIRDQARMEQEGRNTILTDLTNPMLKPLIGQQLGFMRGIYGGADPFAQRTSGAQTTGLNALSSLAGAPQTGGFANVAPTQAFNVQQPGFGALPLSRVGVQGQPLGMPQTPQVNVNGTQFGELQNPYGGMGTQNPGAGVVGAALPIFDRNLRAANAQLAAAAPGRFSSAFVGQGIDLNRQAVEDFNLFAGQQLAQGEQLKAQQQQTALNFALGARDLSQQAALGNQAQSLQAQIANQGATLQAAGLQSEAIARHNQAALAAQQLFQQGQLDARGLEQQLFTSLQQLGLDANTAATQAQLQARQMAQGAFFQGQQNQLAGATGAAQFGLQATQQSIAPLLQLMLAGLSTYAPADLSAIVGARNLTQGYGVENGGFVGGGGIGGGGVPQLPLPYSPTPPPFPRGGFGGLSGGRFDPRFMLSLY